MSSPTVVEATDPDALDRAARALRAGQVVGIPTDTVYGLAADPFSTAAVEAVFAIKHRPADVALPVLVGGWEQVGSLAGDLPVPARRLAARYWPGALTLVVPRVPGFAADLGGPPAARHTVGIRWPDHPVVVALCRAVGPLAVTSANRHGDPPITTAAGVVAAFGAPASGGRDGGGLGGSPLTTGGDEIGPGLVLDGGVCDGVPSTVVECLGPLVRCLRAGVIDWTSLSETADDPGADPA